MAEPQGIPDPQDPHIDYTKAPSPMSEMLQIAQAGDVVGLAEAAREQTTFERGDPVVLILAIAMLIMALSKFVERSGAAVKPITEAVAEKMKREPKA